MEKQKKGDSFSRSMLHQNFWSARRESNEDNLLEPVSVNPFRLPSRLASSGGDIFTHRTDLILPTSPTRICCEKEQEEEEEGREKGMVERKEYEKLGGIG